MITILNVIDKVATLSQQPSSPGFRTWPQKRTGYGGVSAKLSQRITKRGRLEDENRGREPKKMSRGCQPKLETFQKFGDTTKDTF